MSLNEWSCGTVSEKQPPYAGFIDLEYGCRSGHLHCMRLKTGQDESDLGVLHTRLRSMSSYLFKVSG